MVIFCTNAQPITIQLPGTVGSLTRFKYVVKKVGGSGVVTVIPPAGKTLDGLSGLFLVTTYSGAVCENFWS